MMNKCSKIRLQVSVLRTNGPLVIFCSTMLCKVYSQYDENMDTQKEYQPSLEKTNNFVLPDSTQTSVYSHRSSLEV